MKRAIFCMLSLAMSASVIASEYRAGVARIVITPQQTMWAGGYGARTHAVSEKYSELYARALVLEDEKGYRLAIITTDLLGLPRNLADPIADALMKEYQLKREQIVISSSHTHSGPVLRDNLVDIYPMGPDGHAQIDRYSKWLHEQVLKVVADAMAHMGPAKLSQTITQAGFAVNRRENKDAQVKGFEGTKGPFDHDVPVLRVAGPDGKLRAVLFGYACHNTTMDWYKWFGDYAGVAEGNLEAAHAGAMAMFFMGCGADQNPLPRRKVELAEKYGKELSDAVEKAMGGEMKPIEGPFAAAFKRVELPFAHVPTREELQGWTQSSEKNKRAMAKRLLPKLDAGEALPATYPYSVQAIQLGKNLTVAVLAGEVVVDYSLRLKKELGHDQTWVAAYCNDVFAYIPTRRVLAEGGYEGDTSMGTYGHPSKWAPDLEEKIVATVHALVGQVRGKR